MSRYILLLLAAFTILDITTANYQYHTCPLNENWEECGTACPPTCDDPEPESCTSQCVKGCQCKPGWVRTTLGICIPKEWCPSTPANACPLNEVWNECGTACPSSCENPEPIPCTKQCVQCCECKPGWLRNKLGLCIPEALCPATNEHLCPLNEEWKECGSACPPTCENPGPTVCTEQCVQGCQCKPGWLRSKLGLCVPEKWCRSNNDTCPSNENWKECGTACPPTCDNPKPRVCTKQCVQGCQCNPGLVRNKSGQCVPEKSCPNNNQTCPTNENWEVCGTACPPTCDNPKPTVCTKQCVQGCQCKSGLVRSKSGQCIPEISCPNNNQTCPPNENWNECGTACPPTCDTPNPTICTLQCVRGCECKPGLVRNNWGQCIPPNSCPKNNHTCPPNENWNECGTACPPTCDSPNPTICTLQCVQGCQCKPGLVRNKSGQCIPPNSCPNNNHTCPPNENWNECGTACPPTCDTPNPTICTLQCVQGCQCKPGLVRNKSGQCIPPNSCPNNNHTCPPNENWNECGTACPPTCDTPNPTICTLQCVQGCQCKPGLVRNKSGQCIPPNSCPNNNHTCPPNENWNECGTACPPTCDTPNPTICTLQCVQGCQCKTGLVRNKSGQCIPPNSCPNNNHTCPPNENWNECGTACPPTCDTPNPTICTLQCVQGCQCKPGLVRNKSGQCIPPNSCPNNNHTCPPNENWNECGTACPPTCDTPNPTICTLECVQGCQCKPGLVRNKSGQCIPPNSCPNNNHTCPPNENWNECGTACPPTCDTPNPTICTLQCVQGCQCKPGLVRNKSGQCIPPNSCPNNNHTCPPNENWNECGTACPPTCDTPNPTICTLQCVQGCQCKPGLVRNKSGQCIPPNSCPNNNHTCPPNENWNECGTACPPTCDTPNPTICTLECVQGCQCKPGLVRNKWGQCIPPNSCPNNNHTCPPNENWNECGTACPPTCETPNPTICTLQCVQGCQCKTGLVRNKSGQCIPPNSCPNNNHTCPPNENWNECGTACPPTCDTPNPTICTLQCVQGCQCKPGLVRNKSGQCIPPNSCPNNNHTCPPNENWNECGTACPPTCETPNPTICTLQCVQGCQCKTGLVRNKSGQCIPPNSCPNNNHTCPPNENWNECGTACPPTCDTPNPTICTLQCVQGCQCKPGLVRNKSGQCIPPNSCPNNNHTCPPNENWNECGTACPPTCDTPNPTICTLECVQGCQCKPGLVRNKSGQCIPPNSCPNNNHTCPPREEWNECGTACPPTCKNPNPEVCSLQCVGGCQCKPGLLRNKWGFCVPKRWCCA